MKKIILLALFIATAGIINAQEKVRLQVIDNDTRKPVTSTSVSVNKTYYFTSDEQGVVAIPLSRIKPGDSLYVSSIAYRSKIIAFSSIDRLPSEIFLEPAIYALKEVTVLTNKKTRKVEVGNPTGFTINKYFPNYGHAFALYIPNPEGRSGYIKNVSFKISDALSGQKEPFKVRILSCLESRIYPGSDLINDDIVASNPNGKSWVSVGLIQYSLPIPKTGFFIVFEILPESYYQDRTVKKHNRNFAQLPAIAVSRRIKNLNTFIRVGGLRGKWFELQDLSLMIKSELIIEETFRSGKVLPPKRADGATPW